MANASPSVVTCCFGREGLPDCLVGIEICEDVWVANPPSGKLAVAGATVLLNLSASPELLGKMEYRRALVQNQSARLPCGLPVCLFRSGGVQYRSGFFRSFPYRGKRDHPCRDRAVSL